MAVRLCAAAGVATLWLGALSACGGEASRTWHDEGGYRWRELANPGSDQPGFAAMDPGRTGIAFTNTFSEANLLANDILANGSGVALGDYDEDGLADVYLTSIEGASSLYRNLGDWRFEDVTEETGVGLLGSVSRGAAWVDLDGDGDLDLIVTRHSEPNVFFRNDGEGGFSDDSETMGFDAALASHSLAVADTDGDGDLDVYITNYKDRWARDTYAPADRAYDRVVGQDGDRYFIQPGFEDYFRVVRTDQGWQRWEFAQPDEFYHNENGRLRRVSFTEETFVDEDGARFDREPDEWGLSARFVDLDRDGDPDLYVCNDINSPDHIWINDGSGRFRLIDALAIRKTSAASMAVDVSDVDRDGWPDVFVAEMLSPDPVRRKTQVPEVDPNPSEPGEIRTRPQVKRNTLQMSRGDGTFAETAYQAGVAASGWTWGALFLDVDLDGFDDLLSTNGTVLDWLDGDAQERTQGASGGEEWRRLRLQFPPLETRNIAFRNVGDGKFVDAGDEWAYGAEEDISHGLAGGDLDGDGDLDVVINRLNAPALVLRNEASAARVAVRLRGSAANTRGVGALVAFAAAGLPVQTQEVKAGGLYLSHSDDQLTFAAPGEGSRLTVTWPSGARTDLPDVRSGRVYEVREPSTVPAPVPAQVANPASRWFEDVSSQLGHTHHETFFNEFTRQPLLPHRLAQLGPGVSWIDDDGDGDPDLWVGAGQGGRITRFENLAGVLRAQPVGPPVPADVSTILGAPTTNQVLVGHMNYESTDPRVGTTMPSVVALEGGRSEPIVPGSASTTGPMAMADYDGDGDVDLFVGGRAIPTAYPLPTEARFFLNDGTGRWSLDARNASALPEGALVSGAVFSDLDADGDPDLVLATDWGPVRILENQAGGFRDVTDARGLGAHVGRWNGVATGDLNEDGRPDLVVSAWGENTEAALNHAGQEILHADFDRNGMYDIIELETRADGSQAPSRRLDQLTRGLPFLRRVVGTHQSYAATDLESLLVGADLSTVARLSAPELRHMVFLSKEGGYEARPLPALAQRAPSFGLAIADFDSDGHQDVVLAQNFFATRLETPRYDAGRGVLLRGDGLGGLTPIPAMTSGFAAYGDGRGVAAADFDADGRIDLAVGQNGGPTRLFRNVTPQTGAGSLRVRLTGPDANPHAIGATVTVEYADGPGPTQEVQAGSGYWSQSWFVQTLGLRTAPVAVRVRFPDGESSRVAVEPGVAEIGITHPRAGR